MIVTRLASVISILLVVGLSACQPAPSFESDFPAATARVWAGEAFHANRLLDWRLRGGRLECIEGRTAKPMRTVHLLTHALSEEPGILRMAVQTGAVDPVDAGHENTWTGFLIGAGGEGIDYRISALVHHWPAESGGLIVGLDGTGQIVVRDNTNPDTPKGPRSDFAVDAWPLIEPTASEMSGERPDDVILVVQAEPMEGGYRLIATVRDAATDEIFGEATYERLPAEQFTGNVALVSHGSPSQSGLGYWFRDWTLAGSKVRHHPDRAFGPILGTQYTLSRGTLKLTAQMPPLGPDDTPQAALQVQRDGAWETVATEAIVEDSYTLPFRVENWDAAADVPYRVVYDLRTGDGTTTQHTYAGTIRRDPLDQDEIVVGSLNCYKISGGDGTWTHDHFWFPSNELVAAVEHHDPDFLFFAGDQIYEGGLEGIVRTPTEEAIIDYLAHWYRWVWTFRDLTRDRPTVTIPDDHDVYHGNIFGSGGKKAEGDFTPLSDAGGYIQDATFVNAVHRTQVSHLPDPFDPTPIEQGISVYYTDVQYGGISFAVIADRMWKSSPTIVLPEGDVVNGWVQNPNFDPATDADVPEAVLLGERQLDFLDQWAHDWSNGTWMKVLLSQTLFGNLATLPEEATGDQVVPQLRYAEPGEYVEGDKLGADMDSNGWPQSGRDAALRRIREGFAFHAAGDQHLATFSHYGIDDWRDAGYAFVAPAIANTWPRRWWPPMEGMNREPGAPRYTGDFFDGFGNRMTVLAVANPVLSGREPSELYDRVPGYGIIRFNRAERTITSEAWPRWVDPADPQAEQYHGWPITVQQEANYGRDAAAYLPTLEVEGMAEPVVQVINEATDEPIYTIRIKGSRWRPKVFDAATTYTVTVGEPGTDQMQTLTDIAPTADTTAVLEVSL